jgi:hypothetical protein
VQYHITAGCGNTPYGGKGITMTSCAALSHTNFFVTSAKARGKLQPQLAGGDVFNTELTKSHKFGSSGLNLAFEGLLLGVSLCIPMDGTHNDPCQLGFRIRNTLAHAEGMSIMFFRKPKVSRVFMRRLQTTHGMEVIRPRGHAGHQPKVATSVRHTAATY